MAYRWQTGQRDSIVIEAATIALASGRQLTPRLLEAAIIAALRDADLIDANEQTRLTPTQQRRLVVDVREMARHGAHDPEITALRAMQRNEGMA